MNLTALGLSIAGLIVMYRLLSWWLSPVRHHDLTRSGFAIDGEWHPAVDQLTGERRNDLSVNHYLRVSERGGHRVRPVVPRPEQVQLHGWEDDGGAIA